LSNLRALTNFWFNVIYQTLTTVVPPVYKPAASAFSTHRPPRTLTALGLE
jgi:hypothetical protein